MLDHGGQMMSESHTEPKLVWTRWAGFLALAHGFGYSLYVETVDVNVLWFDLVVIICWMLGGNGRAAIVDVVRHWKGNKD